VFGCSAVIRMWEELNARCIHSLITLGCSADATIRQMTLYVREPFQRKGEVGRQNHNVTCIPVARQRPRSKELCDSRC
jgi:hypothetical protein